MDLQNLKVNMDQIHFPQYIQHDAGYDGKDKNSR